MREMPLLLSVARIPSFGGMSATTVILTALIRRM